MRTPVPFGAPANGGGSSTPDWMNSVTADETLSRATLWINPAKNALSGDTPRYVFSRHNGVGYVTKFGLDESVFTAEAGISRIFEGDCYSASYLAQNADTLSGIAGKTTLGLFDYYQLANDAHYIEWDYSGSLTCNGIVVWYARSASNTVLEICRNRGGTITAIAEVDCTVAVNGGTITNVTGDAHQNVALSATLISGDKLRIRRKAGSANSGRVMAACLYDSSQAAAATGDIIVVNEYPITQGSGTTTSSIDLAYSACPSGGTPRLFGSIAHLSPFAEINRVVTYNIDGSPVAATRGPLTGTFTYTRDFDVQDNVGPTTFCSLGFVISVVNSGVKIAHATTFTIDSQSTILYDAMLPMNDAASIAQWNDLASVIAVPTTNVTVDATNGNQMQIESTAGGKMVTLSINGAALKRHITTNVGFGNKLYWNRQTEGGTRNIPAATAYSREFVIVLGATYP